MSFSRGCREESRVFAPSFPRFLARQTRAGMTERIHLASFLSPYFLPSGMRRCSQPPSAMLCFQGLTTSGDFPESRSSRRKEVQQLRAQIVRAFLGNPVTRPLNHAAAHLLGQFLH